MNLKKPLTFQEEIKRTFKRIFTYWAPLSMIIGGIGTTLGFYTLSAYTTAIGRPDLMASAIEAKSALVLWLSVISLLVAVYFLVLMTTSMLFGLSVSLFNDSPNLQADLVIVLVFPVLFGIAALMVMIFKGVTIADGYKLICVVLYGCLTILALRKSQTFREAVDYCTTIDLAGSLKSKVTRVFFLIILALSLIGTVISTVLPVSLILKAYSGEDTPEAITKLMLISIIFASMTLIPVVVFYTSKADLFKRISLCLATASVVSVVIIGGAPGGTLTIVYSAASLMKVRDPMVAKFLLTENYATEDFDTEVWDSVETLRTHPLVSAFPLFSFGEVLLLCPAKLVKTEIKDWPNKSAYCVLTKSSKTLQMPRKSQMKAAKNLTKTESRKSAT
ncbi:hypothetical protein VXM67_05430 [Pseudomonas sp. Rh2]|uniref:hypothetical protein n=1 Tax=Pseudomonas sp. Rh2 TaxID=3112956 RepID=UPI00345D423C